MVPRTHDLTLLSWCPDLSACPHSKKNSWLLSSKKIKQMKQVRSGQTDPFLNLLNPSNTVNCYKTIGNYYLYYVHFIVKKMYWMIKYTDYMHLSGLEEEKENFKGPYNSSQKALLENSNTEKEIVLGFNILEYSFYLIFNVPCSCGSNK